MMNPALPHEQKFYGFEDLYYILGKFDEAEDSRIYFEGSDHPFNHVRIEVDPNKPEHYRMILGYRLP